MKRGRRSKLTDELCEAICQNIREGNTLKYSVQSQGITEQTFYNWMEKGEKSKSKTGKFFEFFESIKKAREEGKNNLVKGIQKHGQNNWQALAWLLERMHPQEFGRQQRVEMEHSGEIKQEHSGKVEVSIHDRIQQRAAEYRKVLNETSDAGDNG